MMAAGKIDKISGKEEDVEAGFSGGMKVFVSLNSFDELYDDSVKKILSSFDNYVKQGSGLIYGYTKWIILKIARYKLSGGCYVSLPHPYNRGNSIINIKSRNNNCFEVAVLCGLMWKTIPRNNEYKFFLPDNAVLRKSGLAAASTSLCAPKPSSG